MHVRRAAEFDCERFHRGAIGSVTDEIEIRLGHELAFMRGLLAHERKRLQQLCNSFSSIHPRLAHDIRMLQTHRARGRTADEARHTHRAIEHDRKPLRADSTLLQRLRDRVTHATMRSPARTSDVLFCSS